MVDEALRAAPACYHEAAHAVLNYHGRHVGLALRYVSVKSAARPDLRNVCTTDRLWVSPTQSLVLLLSSLAGRYAGARARGRGFEMGGGFKEFVEHAESDEGCTDCKVALENIRLSAKGASDLEDLEERLYLKALEEAATLVEEFWPEIEVVAEKLSEDGYLTGEEVGRIVEGFTR